MTHDRAKLMRAEATGSSAEATIRAVLTSRGYTEMSAQALLVAEPAVEQRAMFGDFTRRLRPERLFVAQFPIGASIYGLPLFTDFLLHGAPGYPAGLAIEVKWQQSQGSVDEKFPYLVNNICECYPCPALVIADGGGQRLGAIQWLRNQVGPQLIAIHTLAEFLAWANRHL